jgi:hypothetical protein
MGDIFYIALALASHVCNADTNFTNFSLLLTTDWRNSPILAYSARGRGFDSRTVQIFVYMNMSVCIRSGRFPSVVCMYLQKKSM